MKYEHFASAREELDELAHWLDPKSASAEVKIALTHYATPAVIYGRRGGDSDDRKARGASVPCDVVVRRTGGGAVLAGPWLQGVHLWLPATHPIAKLFPIPSLVWLGGVLVQSIQAMGCEVKLADATSMESVTAQVKAQSLEWSCFAGLSHGELLDAAGRKLFGLSQARVKSGVLLSGGLVCNTTPWEMLHYIHDGEKIPNSPMETLVSDGEFFNNEARCTALWADLLARLNTELTQQSLAVKPVPTQQTSALMEA